MIKDYNKTRELFLGHGTLKLGLDITNTKEIFFEGAYQKIGENNKQFIGKNIKECDVNAVVLNFDGKDAIKSIDILIQDLRKIKNRLKEVN